MNPSEPRTPDTSGHVETLRVLLVDADGNARLRTYDRTFLASQLATRRLHLEGVIKRLKTQSLDTIAKEHEGDGDERAARNLLGVFAAISRLSDTTEYDLTGNGLTGTRGRVAILRIGFTDYVDFPEPLAEAVATESRRLIAEHGL